MSKPESESITDGTRVRTTECTADDCDEIVYYLRDSHSVMCREGHSVVVNDA